MSELTNSTSRLAIQFRRVWVSSLPDSLASAVPAFIGLTVLTVVVAYFPMLTGIAPYEGYMLVSLQSYFAGHALYHSFFTQYGPFYFEAMRLIHAVASVQIGHDAGRSITLAFWVAASLALGVASFIATKRIFYGVATQIVAFTVLFVMRNEPMHPGGLIAVLLSMLVLVLAGIGNQKAKQRFVVAGAIVGGILLVKINVGLLAASAFALTTAYFVQPFCRYAWPKMIVSTCFVGMSFVLMHKQLDQPIVRLYAAHVAIAALCCVIVMVSLPRPVERPLSDAICFTIGIIATFVIVLGIALIFGTSAQELVDGIFLAPLRHPENYSFHLLLYTNVLLLDLAALGGALAYVVLARTRFVGQPAVRLTIGMAAVFVGLVHVFVLIFWIVRHNGTTTAFQLNMPSLPFGANPFSMLAFSWVALTNVTTDEKTTVNGPVIVALAISQSLHAYPVAGSQVGWSTFLLAVVALLSTYKGVQFIRAAYPTAGPKWGEGIAALLLLICLAKFCLFDTYIDGRSAYRSAVKLDLPGATHLRLPAESATRFRAITTAINANCPTFISVPGLNSFYIWTRQNPPTTFNNSFWTNVLTSEIQQRIVDQIIGTRDLCLLRNQRLQNDWTGGQPPPERPLWRFVNSGFERISDFGADYLLYKRH
ncbi:MAG: hypothetical protein ACJ8F3_19885 [Xanthobacteraceae bacterium]